MSVRIGQEVQALSRRPAQPVAGLTAVRGRPDAQGQRVYAASTTVHSQVAAGLAVPGFAATTGAAAVPPVDGRSRRTAMARDREPMSTMTVISRTPWTGEVTMTRRTRGWRDAASIGPSCLMRSRACSVVHGTSWLAGRDPASVSLSTCANWLGQVPAGGEGRGSDLVAPGAQGPHPPGKGSIAGGRHPVG
jgi:hypothetical protein